MNKIQMIELLKLRGITYLNGSSLFTAIKESGGDPKDKEMVSVNYQSMLYYINMFNEAKTEIDRLKNIVELLEKKAHWLSCLERAGVDNWEGYDIAIDIKNESE